MRQIYRHFFYICMKKRPPIFTYGLAAKLSFTITNANILLMKFTTDFPFPGAKLRCFFGKDYHVCFSFFAICNLQKTNYPGVLRHKIQKK
jgi:hypothetical protein